MADYSAGQERALKKFISSYRCSVCRRAFNRDNVRVAAKQEQLWIVSVRCTLCRNQQVFWVALREDGHETLLRDVTDAEEEQFAGMDPISSNDVLDMHQFLADFNGNFREFFDR